MIHCDECLPTKSYSIYATLNEVAAEVDVSHLVESRRDVGILCVGRANAVKRAPSSGEKTIAVRIHIHRSVIARVGNIKRRLPVPPAIDCPAKLAGVTGEEASPK